MGYYVNTTEGTVTVPKANLDAAYMALCDLNKHDHLKTGGSWGGDGVDARSPRPAGMDYHHARWFSWMDANYPETCADAKAIMEMVGFWCDYDDDGNLRILSYDNKTGSEQEFIGALSPFCAEGSFFTWRGEEGEQWREYYGGDEVRTQTATVVWN